MRKHACFAAGLAFAMALPASAQFRKPEDAVRYRQSVMFVMGQNFYTRIGGMVNGRIPYDAKLAAQSADNVVFLSRMPFDAFPAGTENIGRTEAKPSVWSEPAKFKELQEKMQSEVAKLAAVAKTSDFEALKVAYRAAGAACKQCHDTYTNQ